MEGHMGDGGVPPVALTPAAGRLVGLVAEHPDGITLAELTKAAQGRFTGLHPRRVTDLVNRAVAAGALVEAAGRLRVPRIVQQLPEPARAAGPATRRPLRAVAIDLESVVHTTTTEPFLDKRIFQIGAVRFGTDAEWTAADPRRGWFVELPDETWEIRSESLRNRHAAAAVGPAAALLELHAYTADADVVVTYNGTEADFPLLAAAYEREGLPMLAPAVVDAYYLTLSLWPTADSHRLAELADALGVDRTGLGWHDAGDDAELLVRLLMRAADEVAAWPADLNDLIASACADSPAWTLVRHLAAATRGPTPGQPIGAPRAHGIGDVAAVLGALLSGHTPRRSPHGTPPAATPGRSSRTVDAELRGADGRVDPVLLASLSHGAAATRRPAQEQMTTALHGWADAGVPALVEAPTGTGKSLAILAAALDWLAGAPQRTAIIATFTKQLQAQLADDVARLDKKVSGLLAASDVVKGAGEPAVAAGADRGAGGRDNPRRPPSRAPRGAQSVPRPAGVPRARRLPGGAAGRVHRRAPLLGGALGRPGRRAGVLHRVLRPRAAGVARVAEPGQQRGVPGEGRHPGRRAHRRGP
jgi:ATP-dependent DNA helicase RecQ